jgi:hypothetical protein
LNKANGAKDPRLQATAKFNFFDWYFIGDAKGYLQWKMLEKQVRTPRKDRPYYP